jgi:hypothetical protein
MGVISNIKHDEFPKQTEHVGKEVEVCFHYDTNHRIMGKIVRDDAEPPYESIFQLEDGRFVRATECQYR